MTRVAAICCEAPSYERGICRRAGILGEVGNRAIHAAASELGSAVTPRGRQHDAKKNGSGRRVLVDRRHGPIDTAVCRVAVCSCVPHRRAQGNRGYRFANG